MVPTSWAGLQHEASRERSTPSLKWGTGAGCSPGQCCSPRTGKCGASDVLAQKKSLRVIIALPLRLETPKISGVLNAERASRNCSSNFLGKKRGKKDTPNSVLEGGETDHMKYVVRQGLTALWYPRERKLSPDHGERKAGNYWSHSAVSDWTYELDRRQEKIRQCGVNLGKKKRTCYGIESLGASTDATCESRRKVHTIWLRARGKTSYLATIRGESQYTLEDSWFFHSGSEKMKFLMGVSRISITIGKKRRFLLWGLFWERGGIIKDD